MPVSLAGQTVLVIGASSGIGRATAVLFAQEGCHVIAAARRAERLQQLHSELTAQGYKITVAQADAARHQDLETLAATAGVVDILVFAAGTNTPDRALTRLKPEIWNELIQTNLNGAYYATAAVLPQMRERKSGQLLFISSISGLTPDVSGAAYQASKRGLVGLAHAIRVEEKENGIRTSVICPGLVDTEILERRPVKPSADQIAKALQPEDIAELTLAIAKLPARAAIPEVQIMPTYL